MVKTKHAILCNYFCLGKNHKWTTEVVAYFCVYLCSTLSPRPHVCGIFVFIKENAQFNFYNR